MGSLLIARKGLTAHCSNKLLLITTRWVVRISFVSIFLYQVSFVRSDKGFDGAPCKTVGTSRDLARLFKRSQDFLGKPEEKDSSGEESIENPGKTSPKYISPRQWFENPANSCRSTTFWGLHQSSSSWTPLSWPSRYSGKIWQPCAARQPDVAMPIS